MDTHPHVMYMSPTPNGHTSSCYVHEHAHMLPHVYPHPQHMHTPTALPSMSVPWSPLIRQRTHSHWSNQQQPSTLYRQLDGSQDYTGVPKHIPYLMNCNAHNGFIYHTFAGTHIYIGAYVCGVCVVCVVHMCVVCVWCVDVWMYLVYVCSWTCVPHTLCHWIQGVKNNLTFTQTHRFTHIGLHTHMLTHKLYVNEFNEWNALLGHVKKVSHACSQSANGMVLMLVWVCVFCMCVVCVLCHVLLCCVSYLSQ